MSRRTEREAVFKLLFRREFNSDEEMMQQISFFFDETEESGRLNDEEKEIVEGRYNRIVDFLPEIDNIISANAEGWDISRMGKVDLTIIRLAVFEIRFDDDIPELVAIDEAVEIAKKYGGDASPSFVNGVLAKVVVKPGENDE